MSILKLEPFYKDYIWGGTKLIQDFEKSYQGERLAEAWKLSCHPSGPSKIVEGEGCGQTLSEYIQTCGKRVLGKHCEEIEDFPILIKLIDAADSLSIQVHPDNAYALEHEGEQGKTEMWYIVDCEEDAFIYYGFSEDITREELKVRIENSTILEVLNKVTVHKGDTFLIEAGTIHAIGKGILIAEIQQNSNLTYRVYDFDRRDEKGNGRELHIEKALDVTNRKKMVYKKEGFPHLSRSKYFSVDQIYLDGTYMKGIQGRITEASFVSFLILDGTGTICVNGERMQYSKGDSLFIPAADAEYSVEGNGQMLFVTIPEKMNRKG